MEKSKKIDPKQCVQILALYRFLRINQAWETFAKVKPQLRPLSQLPVTFTTCVLSDCSPCSFSLVLVSLRERELWGKYWCRQWPGATQLLFIFVEKWLAIETWHNKQGPPHLPPQANLNTVCTSVHCSQRILLSLGRHCPVQSRSSHLPSRGSSSSQGQPKGFTLLLKLGVASGFWNKLVHQFSLSTKSGTKDLTRHIFPYPV